MYQTVLFDLDGTLTDSAPGVIHSVQYALEKYGIAEAYENLQCFIGPPLIQSFQKFYGFDHERAAEAVAYYREYYSAGGIFENSVYTGIPEVLAMLKEAGKYLAVATSKPEFFAKQVLDHFGLTGYFDFIGGALMDETRTTKEEVLAYTLTEMKIDPEMAVMVGDRENDATAARALGVSCIGVLYGYGSREELAAAGCTIFAEHPNDICHIVTGS